MLPRPRSPWAIAAAALAWLVVLAIAIRAVQVALELWLVTVVLAMLALAIPRGRQSPIRGGTPIASATAERPVQQAVVSALGDSVVTPAVSETAQVVADDRGEWGAGLPARLAELPVWTADEVATTLRIEREVVVAAIRDGSLPGNHIGDAWRVRATALLAWLDGPYHTGRQSAPRQRRR